MFKLFSLLLRRLRRSWLYGLLSVTVAISLCIGSQQPGYTFSWSDLIRGGIQVIQLSNLSDSQEVKVGSQINQQLISQGQIRTYRNAQLNRYVNQIGQQLARNSDRPNIPYTFQIVNDRSVNAFATMGGFVYINTGLMRLADNEAELASVIAHEIGHIAGRHAVKQMRQRAINQGLLSATGLDESTVVQLGVQLAVNLPHSREDEFEADRMGLATLRRTGYAPAGMISFMKKLQRQSASVPTFLSTHPATSDRVVTLQRKVDPRTADRGRGLNQQAYKNQISSLR